MGTGDLTIWIDGAQPPTAETVGLINAVCDAAEDQESGNQLVVRASGMPPAPWSRDLTIGLISKWERALRRLERLPVVVVGVAEGDCGGTALDTLLATDYRIASGTARLAIPVTDGTIWPGMALYRMAHQGASPAARRTALFGAPLSAADALAAQLIDEVTDDVPGALAAAAGLAAGLSGREFAVRRQLLADAASSSFEDSLGVHLAACDRALRRMAGQAT